MLLYHVVPGATDDLQAGAQVRRCRADHGVRRHVTVETKWNFVKLVDADANDANPCVVQPNINKGNLQIAHGISAVLRPLDIYGRRARAGTPSRRGREPPR